MEKVTMIFSWICANWEIILGIIGLIIALGLTVSKLTKTPKDDEVFEKADSWFSKIKEFFKKKN